MDILTNKRINLFNGQLIINISEEDWAFLCENRFFTDSPEIDSIEADFITGTGITSTAEEKWSNASDKFKDYIDDLRDIMGLNICDMAKNVISAKEKAS